VRICDWDEEVRRDRAERHRRDAVEVVPVDADEGSDHSSTRLLAVVPPDAVSGKVTVHAQGGIGVSGDTFTVTPKPGP
jgi:hypothetical protein